VHGFSLTADDQLLLAGVDGRFSLYSPLEYLPADWWLTSEAGICPAIDVGECDAQARTSIELTTPTGESAAAFSGNVAMAGPVALVVDHAIDYGPRHDVASCHGDHPFYGHSETRLLFGPAAD
jgi:hypothetical protein